MNDIILAGSCEIQAAESSGKKISIIAYNGDVMSVSPFGALVIDLATLRRPNQVPLLVDHDATLRGVVGHGIAKVEAGLLTIEGQLTTGNEAADRVLEMSRSGFAWKASVGMMPGDVQRIPEGEVIHINNRSIRAGKGGFLLVKNGTLKEVSILAFAADGNTVVKIAARGGETERGQIMETEQIEQAPEADPIQLERERAARIAEICNGKHVDIQARALRENWNEQKTELEVLRANRPSVPSTFIPSRNYATRSDHLAACIMVKAGYSKAAEEAYGPQVMEQSRRLHGHSLPDLCRAALLIDGREVPHGRLEMIRAAASTGSLPVALGDSANKILTTAYRQAPSAWRSFAAVKSAADFKLHTSIRPSFAGDLEQLAPGGQVKHGSYTEETYEWRVDTFAKQFQIDRRDFLNDDASVFSDVIPSLARAAARSLSNLVAETILANSGSFWSAANDNLLSGGGSALSSASLADAIELLRKSKDAEGSVLDLQPAVLLVPPDLEPTARALLNSTEVARDTSSTDLLPMGNIHQNVAALQIEPRLSDSDFSGFSLTAWWLFSDPMNAAVIVGFLEGRETPVIETFGLDHDINQLAFGFRVYHDFGAALGDMRASIRAAGA